MGETRLQKKRRNLAEQIVRWFPKSKDAFRSKLHADAVNKAVEKRKRKQFRSQAHDL